MGFAGGHTVIVDLCEFMSAEVFARNGAVSGFHERVKIYEAIRKEWGLK
jgi:hypothetical protein